MIAGRICLIPIELFIETDLEILKKGEDYGYDHNDDDYDNTLERIPDGD
jgi:hypothetical protein